MKNNDECAHYHRRGTRVLSVIAIISVISLSACIYGAITHAPLKVIVFGLVVFVINTMAFPFVYDAFFYRKLD